MDGPCGGQDVCRRIELCGVEGGVSQAGVEEVGPERLYPWVEVLGQGQVELAGEVDQQGCRVGEDLVEGEKGRRQSVDRCQGRQPLSGVECRPVGDGEAVAFLEGSGDRQGVAYGADGLGLVSGEPDRFPPEGQEDADARVLEDG